MNEWTSVKDKDNYPGFGQVCQVKSVCCGVDFNFVAVAYICPEYKNLMWSDYRGEPSMGEVTHWKPHKTTAN